MSMTISGAVSGAAQVQRAAAAEAPPQAGQAEPPARKPALDEYIPEEKQEPSGRYWLGRDGDGQPKIFIDGPERAGDGPAGSPAPAEKKEKAECCTADTDQVDREIERLKKQKEKLEKQISAQTDEAKLRELERKLAQVERELAQKDNDAYRRRHTVFS